MAKYLLLCSGGGMGETEAEHASIKEAWGAWYGGLGSALVDAGNPFTPAARSVSSDGSVMDGPAGSMASGYSIVAADSLNQAVEMAKGCPVLQSGGNITVYETFEVM